MKRTVPVMVAGALGMGGALASAGEVNRVDQANAPGSQEMEVSALQSTGSHDASAVSGAADATVKGVLDETYGRSHRLQLNGVSAGYDDGRFVLGGDDGNFALRPSGLFQFRYMWNYRDGGVDGMSDRSRSEDGFEVTRLRLGVDGHVLSPDLTYNLVFANDTNIIEVDVLDAWLQWQFADALAVRAGQFRDPTHREFGVVSAGRQLAMDRSLTDNLIGGSTIGRVPGVMLLYDDGGPLRARAALHDGAGSFNTNFVGSPADFGLSGRVEYMFTGQDWTPYEGYNAFDTAEMLVVGGGGSWSSFGSDNVYYYTADVQWNNPMDMEGLALFAAFLGQFNDLDDDDNLHHWGGVIQAGYMLNEKWEVYGRGSFTRMDSDLNLPSNNIYWVTGGVSLHKTPHLRVSAELSWLPRGSFESFPAKGVLMQDTDDDQVIGRVQAQLNF